MEDSQLDSFLTYLTILEESSDQFSQAQVKKLELIRAKVSDIVSRCQTQNVTTSTGAIASNPPAGMLQSTPAGVMERIVSGFSQFVSENSTDK